MSAVPEIQLLPVENENENELESVSDNVSFILTTTSWQRNDISFYHELIIYTILFIGIIGFASIVLFAFVYHHLIYEIIGFLGCGLMITCCFFYYIKHCFGIFYERENRLIFNIQSSNVEIHRNNVFINQIPFDQYDGLSYQKYYVYVNSKNDQNGGIPLNTYRANREIATSFVLNVMDCTNLIKKRFNNQRQFEPIEIV